MLKKTTIRSVAAALVLAGTLGLGAKAEAATIQLGFILDRSGSIGSSNWTTIVNGLSSAINTLVPVGATDTYEISVVSFGSTASADVTRVLVTDAATRSAVAASVAAIAFTGGSTNMAAAFSLMGTTLAATTNAPASTYVNFATDGVADSEAAAIAARNTMISTASVDNISIEAIGTGIDAAFLQGQICYPGPCDTTAPYNFPAQGFYIAVPNAAAYVSAISEKISTVTGVPVVPEPGTFILLGGGLVAVGVLRHRRKKA